MKKRLSLAALKRIFAIVLCAAVSVTYLPLLETSGSKAYALDPESGDSIAFSPASSDYIIDKDMWYEVLSEDDEQYTYSLYFREGDRFTVAEDGSETTYTYSEGAFYDEDDYTVYVDSPQFTGPEINPGTYEFTINYEGASCTFEVNVLPNPIKEIKYEPVKDEYTDAEISAYRNKDEDGGWWYTLPYRNGDKLTIDWSDEQLENTVYTYTDNVFVDEDGKEIDSEKLEALSLWTDEDITGSNNPYSFSAQFDGKSFDADILVSDSSVTSVIYNPVVKERTDRDIMNHRDDGDSLYAYTLPFEIGDTLTVNQSSGSKTYTYKEDAIRYEDDGEAYYVNGFVDANNNPLNDEDVFYPYYESEEEIVAGRTYEFVVMYKGVKVKTPIIVIPSPIDDISFEPSKKAYSEAELIAYEDFYPARDDEDTDEYYYYLDFNVGDKLVIDWNDSEKEDTTYVYTENAIEHKEGNETYYEAGFVDKAKIEEPIDLNDISGPNCESDHRLTVADSPCEFYVEYQKVQVNFDLDITESSDEEKTLAEEKRAAEKALYAIDEKYDLSNKIEKKAYRPAQIDELYKAWDKAIQAIENAKSKADLDRAVAAYEAAIKAVKTDAQMKADEAAAKKAADELKEWNGTRSSKVPAVKSAKFKAAKKKVTVSWKKATKKNLKKFDKVEIQVCKDKKFQKANTKRVEVKKSKKSATVKGLKKGTYYVRVRNVKGSGVNKIVSKWSKAKKVKVK